MIIYIDANVFKFSATKLLRLFPREQTVNWGHTQSVHKYYEMGYLNPNDQIKDADLKKEAELLKPISEYIKKGSIKAVSNIETIFETFSIPNMGSEEGSLYGSEIMPCPCPVTYQRILVGGKKSAKELQFDFISKLKNPRFLEIQKVVGAYQGQGKIQMNQMLDAFALWCAEHNGCSGFLTLDFKLARVVRSDPKARIKIPIMRPSELISLINENGA